MIAPTLTFVASVNVIEYNGVEFVFMDADQYYNIDVDFAGQSGRKYCFRVGPYFV